MNMAELKTKQTRASVQAFLNKIEDEEKRRDALVVAKMMQEATRSKPAMWGPSIIGFGSRRLKYPSGRELDWMVAAFSPRKTGLVIYVLDGSKKQAAMLKKLGKHTTGKSCLYIRRLSDVDTKVLEGLIVESVRNTTGAGQ
jgi:hypothetical protein